MRIGKSAIPATVVAALTLTACGGSNRQQTYDVSGQITDKQIEEECSRSRAAGSRVVEVEPASYQDRSSGGGSGSGSGRGSSGSRSNTGNNGRDTSQDSGSSGGTAGGTTGGTSTFRQNCHTEYELFLDGSDDDVDVTEAHYEQCAVGERFPRCTGNGQ